MYDHLFTPELLWFIGGLLFLLAELATPGGFVLMFFGAGCWVAALAAGLLHLGLNGQLVAFVAATMLFLLTLRRMFVRIFRGKTLSRDLERDESPVGHRAEVTRAISAAEPGEVRYRGSYWRAYAEEAIASGTSVVITGPVPGENSAFLVERPGERPAEHPKTSPGSEENQ